MLEKRSVFSSGKLHCAILRCIPVRANAHNLIGSVYHRHGPNWVTGQKMDQREMKVKKKKKCAGSVEMVGGRLSLLCVWFALQKSISHRVLKSLFSHFQSRLYLYRVDLPLYVSHIKKLKCYI